MHDLKIILREEELMTLKNMIGKKLVKYEHEEFIFTDTVSNVVRFDMEDDVSFLYCFTEEHDYYGTAEDVAVLSIEKVKYPIVDNKHLISMPVDEDIKNIYVVNDSQRVKYPDEEYSVDVTRGIIIDFGEYQISFEKYSWMMEEIAVKRGYDLIERFTPVDDFVSRHSGATDISYNREVVSLK